MRRCIFVLGSRAQLVEITPFLKKAQDAGLVYSIWFTAQDHESVDGLADDLGLVSSFVQAGEPRDRSTIGRLLVWLPKRLNDCFRYVNSVKLWIGRRPLVVVHAYTLSTWIGAVAGRWGGGDIVHLDSGKTPGGMLPRRILRKVRYAICADEDAARRMERYSGCIVANIGASASIAEETASRTAVETLARWAS